METAVIVRPETLVEGWSEKAKEYIGCAKSPATLRAYRTAWSDFAGWCEEKGLQSLPAAPATVAEYAADRAATLKAATLQKNLAAISVAHQTAGHTSPTGDSAVRIVMQGIRRSKGTAPQQKAPAVTSDVRAMVEMLPDSLLGVRDRALLLLGFAGAFRRSELVALDVEDLTITSEGISILLRRSKTDQQAQGRRVGVPYGSNPATCPVRSLVAWLETSSITKGPLFRSINRHGQIQPGRLCDKAVALVVKRQAEAAGLDAAQYSGHS